MSDIKITKMDILDESTNERVTLYPSTVTRQIVDFGDCVSNLVGPLNIIDYSDVVGPYVPVLDTSYDRESLFSSNHTVIAIPAETRYMVNGKYFYLADHKIISLSEFVNAQDRAGKDVYIYAVDPDSDDPDNVKPTFVLSLNSTWPDGYDHKTSRKIGGFHCLCKTANLMIDYSGRMEQYFEGDILPYTHWDLLHKPACDSPEGMTFVPGLNIWVDIYLNSSFGDKLISVSDGVIADGNTENAFHWNKFNQVLAASGKRMPSLVEFMEFALGTTSGLGLEETEYTVTKQVLVEDEPSDDEEPVEDEEQEEKEPQYEEISESVSVVVDPHSTGSHVFSTGDRIVSMYGVEDCAGIAWQCGIDSGGPESSIDWINAFDENDSSDVKGRTVSAPKRLALGGGYMENPKFNGSGTYRFDISPLYTGLSLAVRGVSENKSPTNINQGFNTLKDYIKDSDIDYVIGFDQLQANRNLPDEKDIIHIANDKATYDIVDNVILSSVVPADKTAIWLEEN